MGTVNFVPTERGLQPEGLHPHAALLRQAFAHCARFPTAASRRSLDRVSVPVWPAILSDRLPIIALVSRYLANKLIGLGPLLRRLAALSPRTEVHGMLCGISPAFAGLFPTEGQVAQVLRTRAPCASTSIATRTAHSTCMC